MPPVPAASWRNWSGGQRCAPAVLERPGTRGEVAAAIARARAAGREVRVAGAGHSFSPAVLTDGALLDLRRLDRVLDADRATGLVRVEAGITLRRLSAELLARGLALPNLGDVDAQSLAGALATGTHGTGARLPNLSAQVAALELVLADGTERRLGGEDGDLLRAARVSLGALGVVVAVTLRCVPAFRLRGVDRPEPLTAVLDELDARVAAHDHFELYTFPHSPVALTRTNDRTEAPVSARPRARAWAEDVLLDNHAFHGMNLVARRLPRAVPRLNRLAGAAAARRERVDWSHRVFTSPRLVRFEELEYALPRERAAEAVLAVRRVLERHPVSFPIELRFSAGDDALLSPAGARGCAWIAVHVFAGMPFEGPLREVEALLAGWGGRPHWGKRTFRRAGSLARAYPSWDGFQGARRELDPEGRFANRWVREVLGEPVAAPAGA
jgi:L-gulono-1,4-lactone dehydrogenase